MFPKKPVLDIEIPKSISNSVFCHVSVTTWCKVSGDEPKSKPQKERCKRLAADTVKKTVEILNAHFPGGFKAAMQFDETANLCRSCHISEVVMQKTRDKMHCTSCHSSLSDEHPLF